MRFNDLIDSMRYADPARKKKVLLGSVAGVLFLVAAVLLARALFSSGAGAGAEVHRRFARQHDASRQAETAAIEQRQSQREDEARRAAEAAGHDANGNGKNQISGG